MKTVTPQMEAHLKEGATTMTTCWKITRTDGQVFHYTELDEDLTYLGDVYRSAAGFNKSAIQSSATFAVDKMEVTGFLRDDGITDEEIRNGAFDHASVEVFMVNYMDLSMGAVRQRAGWFGEVRTTGSGAFMVELRGLIDQLQVKVGRTYLPECGVDLGSPKCGIKLIADLRNAGAYYSAGDRVVWPVGVPDYIGEKHFPQLVDPNIEGIWFYQNVVGQNINVTPVKGPKMVRMSTKIPFRAERTVVLNFSDLGFTPEDVTSGLYQVTFRAKAYRMSRTANGRLVVNCQERYFTTNTFSDISEASVKIPLKPPFRKWEKWECTLDVHPDTDRFLVRLIADPDPTNTSPSDLYFDDLDFFISLKAESVNQFLTYGGVEFEAQTTGKSTTGPVTFDPTLGEETVDGGVTWKAVVPRYTFLRALTANMTATNRLTVETIDLPWENYFDWGVVKFLTGKNAGRAMEIQDFNPDTGVIKLALPLPYQGLEGDMISIQAGCNKTAKSCALFENILNFRGHPRVPGQGQYFKIAGM